MVTAMTAFSRFGTTEAEVSIGRVGRSWEWAARGYAAVFHDDSDRRTRFELLPKVYEHLAVGAFDEALERRDVVLGRLDHEDRWTLGSTTDNTLRLWADAKGLGYEIRGAMTSSWQRLIDLHTRDEVKGSSFEFSRPRDYWSRSGGEVHRSIESLHLSDVAPCRSPAYLASTFELRSRLAARIAGSATTQLPIVLARFAGCSGSDPRQATTYYHSTTTFRLKVLAIRVNCVVVQSMQKPCFCRCFVGFGGLEAVTLVGFASRGLRVRASSSPLRKPLLSHTL